MNKELITFFQCYFNHKVIEETPTKEFLKLLEEQSLLPYAYIVYQKKEFKPFYVSAVLKQEEFRKLQEEITNLFNEKQIPHFYIKGSVLHTLYPDMALRTRGDIDVVIDPAYLEVAKKVLEQNQFELEEAGCMHHVAYFKNKLCVELHFSLFDVYENDDRAKYFQDPFALCNLYKDHLYYLNHMDHFIFCLCHFAHHLKTGAGVRYCLDFYYMLKNWNLDLHQLHQKISQFGFDILYENILNLIEALTKEKLDEFKTKEIDFFMDYLCSSGIHGSGQNENLKEKQLVRREHKVKYLFNKLLMINKTYRLSLYPKLGKHWYTYIFCLIHHSFYLLTHKLKYFFIMMFHRKSKEEKNKEKIFKEIGI